MGIDPAVSGQADIQMVDLGDAYGLDVRTEQGRAAEAALAGRGLLDDAAMGELRFPAPPVRIDRQSLPVRMAPRLGEHTDEVLRELGVARAAEGTT